MLVQKTINIVSDMTSMFSKHTAWNLNARQT